MGRRSVLIFSHEPVGPSMAGPVIRYLALADVLAKEFDVVLAVPETSEPVSTASELLPYSRDSWEDIRSRCLEAEVIVLPADLLTWFPDLGKLECPIVIDGYDPHPAENLMWMRDQSIGTRVESHNHSVDLLLQQCRVGDFFLCAGEVQRTWWLGLLEATGRINPYTFDEDPSLRSLIAVVPFGLPSEPLPEIPVDFSIPGVGPRDRVLLWGGGLWEWLDPITAIRAMPKVLESISNVRLLFPGTQHPNPEVGEMPMVGLARKTAAGLGLLGTHVIFGDWVQRARWPYYLRRADVGLSLHPDTIEAHLAFRSRLLDYIWAVLPMVVSRGDETGVMVDRYGLGKAVDVVAIRQVSEAILELLSLPKVTWEPAFENARSDFTWDTAARPLIEFCRQPRFASDKRASGHGVACSPCERKLEKLRQHCDALEGQRDDLDDLVKRYENGHFMHLMRWLKNLI